jgi:hypothetical protein
LKARGYKNNYVASGIYSGLFTINGAANVSYGASAAGSGIGNVASSWTSPNATIVGNTIFLDFVLTAGSTASACDWNGTAGTLYSRIISGSGATQQTLYSCLVMNVTAGTHPFHITDNNGGGSGNLYWGWTSYTANVSPVDANAEQLASSSGGVTTQSLTTTASNVWIHMAASNVNNNAMTANGANTTIRFSDAGNMFVAADTNGGQGAAGTKSMAFTTGNSVASIMVSIKP